MAIAAALVLEPDGLICDEPVSMLDVSVRAQILQVLIELRQRRDLALLFITHDLSLAWSLCDRLAVMYLGRIVEQGAGRRRDRAPAASLHPGARRPRCRCRPPAARIREPLSGELPDATNVPSRCRFHPRCPRRFEPCDTRRSGAAATSGRGQLAACLLHDPELAPDAVA